MLFSEPKIPQCSFSSAMNHSRSSFSALQRAENSSIKHNASLNARPTAFQCSSASRKFLNLNDALAPDKSFAVSVLFSEPKIPQCDTPFDALGALVRFSALQRAENSSMEDTRDAASDAAAFQCSSASRKFLNATSDVCSLARRYVSVLFSEPKIPQCTRAG